jgi:ABC-type hemin transport system ATPase subunit
VDPRILIKKLTFSDGTEIVPEANDVLVIVGPNNSGKSALLRAVRGKLGRSSYKSPVLNTVDFEKIGSTDEVMSWLEAVARKAPDSAPDNPQFFIYGFGTHQVHISNA